MFSKVSFWSKLFLSVAITFFLGAGESLSQSSVKVIGVWNGFNDHFNVVECLNPSNKELLGNFTLTNSSQEKIAEVPFRIAAYGTSHTPLNNFPILNDYGLFEITLQSGSKPFCYTALYRLGDEATEGKQIQYAFTLPAGRALRGVVTGTYNSMNPEATAQPVYNWLSVYNLSDTPFDAQLEVYTQDGTVDSEQSRGIYGLQPGQRLDIALGHEVGQVVGLYKIVPKNKTQQYGSFLSRFSLKEATRYNFSFPLIPSTGSCDTGPIPMSTMGPAQNWLEIANISSMAREFLIELRLRDSTLLHSESRVLSGYSQYHLNANNYLGENNIGWFRVRCKGSSTTPALIAQSLFYGRDHSAPAAISWAYASQSSRQIGNAQTFVSAFNTFLSAANWLKILNPEIGDGSTEVGLFGSEGEMIVQDLSSQARGGGLDFDIHTHVGANSYGYVTTKVGNGNYPNAELIRVFPTTLGNIGYIMNVPSFPAREVDGEVKWIEEGEGDPGSLPGGGGGDSGGGSNKAPVAKNGSISTSVNVAKAVTLIASDVDSPTLKYEIVNLPTHGTLSGKAPNLIYTPSNNYYGADHFKFRAFDGKLYSNTATVSISVNTTPGTCGSITVKFPGHSPGDYPSDVPADGILYEDGKNDPISYNSDITFYFDKPYPCGKFATGDWWVKGPVTVTRMTPDHVGDRNGYDVNPQVQHQSFDSRIVAYQPITESLPLTLDPRDGTKSLLKSVSYNPGGSCHTIVQDRNLRSCLLGVAVLTVLKEAPLQQSFRPPYIAGSKPLIGINSLDLNQLPRLPKLPQTIALTNTVKYFGGPYIDHILDWSSRFIHPRANMRASHPFDSVAYGSRLANVINNAILSTMHDDPNSQKLQVVVHISQWGIDLYHQLLAGQYWPENGGHELGRKLPILYAGKLLQSLVIGDAMLNMAYEYHEYGNLLPSGKLHKNYFQEDGGTYYGKGGIALFGGTQNQSNGTYGGAGSYSQLLNTCSGSKTARDPDGLRDGGILYFDHNDPNTMPQSLINYLADFGPGGKYVDAENPPVTVVNKVNECGVYNAQLPTIAQQLASGKGYNSSYQGCCTSKQYTYSATAAKLLGLKERWNHPPFFDYIERWNSPPWNGIGGYSSGYGDAMFEAYYNPRTYDQTVIATSGVLKSLALQAIDAQGDELLYQIVDYPKHGVLSSDNGDKVIRYTSHSNFVGVDSFTFRVSDGADYSNLSKVTLIVNSDPNGQIIWRDDFDSRANGSSDLGTQTAADQLLWNHLSEGKAGVVESLGSKWLRMSGSAGSGDIFVVAQPTFSQFDLSFDVQKPWTSRSGFVFHLQDDKNFYYMIFSGGIGSAFPGADAPSVSGGLYKIVDGVAHLVDSGASLRIPHHGKDLVDSFTVKSRLVDGKLHLEMTRTEKNYGTGTTYSDMLVDPSPSFVSGKFGFLAAYEQYNAAMFDLVEIK